MKSLIKVVCFTFAAVIVTATTAFGGGHSKTYALCGVENCALTRVHSHNGKYFAAHYYGDKHDYHELCYVQGCRKTAAHLHDGVVCLPHATGDGHSYCAAAARSGGCCH